MSERDHYAALIGGANSEGWLLWRLPDAPGLPPRPADLAGCDPAGRAALVEVKVADRWRGVGCLRFEEAQVRYLRAYAARGGLALVAAVPQGRALLVSGRLAHLVRVAGQGVGMGVEVDGSANSGLVAVAEAELHRVSGQWVGWNAALDAWASADQVR